jgi:glycosyltransferase involved in cell wall biosynthesis
MISFGPIGARSNGYFIRVFYIVKSLLNLGHRVSILEFPENEITINEIEEIDKKNIEFIHLRGNEVMGNKFKLKRRFTFDPFHIIKFQLRSLVELIHFRRYFRKSDAVFVEGCLFPSAILLSKLFGKKILLDTHCVNKLLAIGYKGRKPLIYLMRKYLWDILERFSTNLSDLVITVSEKEKKFIEEEYKIQESNISVIPNVVEIPKKKSTNFELEKLKKKWGLENKLIITIVGELESVQNKDAAEYIINELAPYFWENMKDLIFLIVGKGGEFIKCDLPNVIFTGFVDKVGPFLELTDICIAPLRVGAGTKTKVLEYMAYGKPVLTTKIGAEGLNLTEVSGVELCSLEDFPEKLLEVIYNVDFIGKGKGNTQFIQDNYTPIVMKNGIQILLGEI